MSADAVLIPRDAFQDSGSVIRELNGWGKLWALFDPRSAEMSGPRGANGMGACAGRLGVELERCAVLVTDERSRRLAARAGAVGVDPGGSPAGFCAGAGDRGGLGRYLRMRLESLMDRYQALSLKMLGATLREWGFTGRPGSTSGAECR